MEAYKTYLEEKGYTQSTVGNYIKHAQLFIKWCKRNHTTAEEIDYKDGLRYIKYLNRKGNTKKTVNHQLGQVKVYLNYLVDAHHRIDNPLENTNVKGIKRHINYNLLEADELEDLYYSFNTQNIKDSYHQLTAKRNRIIVGLMVYQGLCTTSLRTLELQHADIYKGKIYVPSHKKKNARELELKPWQVVELLEYTKEVREEIKKRKSIESEYLFIPNNDRFSNTINLLVKKLKKTNHKVESSYQIRASVITNWLGQYNLRKVQYLAGHRYISSTERYLQDDLENLHEIVNNFHPIN